MDFIDQSKSILENLSYFSSVIVSLLSIFAIWQLIIGVQSFKLAKEALEQAKNEFKISTERAAAHESAKLCEKFVKDIVIRMNDFEKSNKDLVYPKISGGITNLDDDTKINIINPKETSKTISEIFNPNAEFFLNILNDMETFSMYFTKNIADESIAFQTIGRTYINYVESFHYFILIVNKAQGNTSYRNIKLLYKKWRFPK